MSIELIVVIVVAVVLTLQNKYAALTNPRAQKILNWFVVGALVVWLIWSYNVLHIFHRM
jgi:hypothetical protein